jgi:hypothetical protein
VKKEIFCKTLGFYCTLAEKGCAFDIQKDAESLAQLALRIQTAIMIWAQNIYLIQVNQISNQPVLKYSRIAGAELPYGPFAKASFNCSWTNTGDLLFSKFSTSCLVYFSQSVSLAPMSAPES